MLNWAKRRKIALAIARGLAHLHAGFETPITHGNVRSKNVVVDELFVDRLTEFVLDKLMVPAVADEIVALAKNRWLQSTRASEDEEMQFQYRCFCIRNTFTGDFDRQKTWEEWEKL